MDILFLTTEPCVCCREYAAATSELQKVDLASLNENQRKALFINLYNSIIIHGLTEFGPASNIVTRCETAAV